MLKKASKILAIAYPFAKFAKGFSRQNFPLYGKLAISNIQHFHNSDHIIIEAYYITYNTPNTV